MAMEDYERAKKLADKEQHQRLQKGQSPYLEVLDDLIDGVVIDTRVNLGLVDIPLNQVVGTATAGRTNAFAANFMPLLETNTEFATKWARLCDSMISDGLRDPIVAIEYMNRFYVVEGNKRVSVSKYLGGVSVEATVTRYVPRRTNDIENQIYYEFLPFYNATKINYLNFTQLGYYPQLALHMGYRPGEKWSSKDLHDFRAAYLRFAQQYRLIGGQDRPLGSPDALMLYLDVFGFDSLHRATLSELKANIQKLWEEFQLRSQDQGVAMSMMPEDAPKRTLTSFLKFSPATVRAAFIYDSSADKSGWVYAHELGRKHVEEVFGSRVQTTARELVSPADADRVIRELIADGWDTIFTASPVFLHPVTKVSMEFPDVRILNCSLMATYHQIRSYYLRIFEAKFITGMIAGTVARDGRIGYAADYPIYGTPANINAFALGAKAVNPDAKIYLTWSCLKDEEPRDFFIRNNLTTISNRDINAPTNGSRHFGLYQIDEDGATINLAMPIWDWGKMYESLISSILNGQWDKAIDGTHALNYWWGMSSGAIDVMLSRKLPAGTQCIVDAIRESLQANRFNVFAGEIYDQHGILRSNSHELMSPEDVISMDYLCQNVIGTIPKLDELKPVARPVANLSGIYQSVTPASLQFFLRRGRKEQIDE